MNDELSSKLTEILGAMQTAVGAAKDFTLAQLPDIAQSYVIYGRVWHTSVFVVLLLLCVAIGLAIRKHAPKASDPFFVYVGGGMPLIFFSVGALVTFKNTMLVWFAPKVWLMIKLGELISGR